MAYRSEYEDWLREINAPSRRPARWYFRELLSLTAVVAFVWAVVAVVWG